MPVHGERSSPPHPPPARGHPSPPHLVPNPGAGQRGRRRAGDPPTGATARPHHRPSRRQRAQCGRQRRPPVGCQRPGPGRCGRGLGGGGHPAAHAAPRRGHTCAGGRGRHGARGHLVGDAGEVERTCHVTGDCCRCAPLLRVAAASSSCCLLLSAAFCCFLLLPACCFPLSPAASCCCRLPSHPHRFTPARARVSACYQLGTGYWNDEVGSALAQPLDSAAYCSRELMVRAWATAPVSSVGLCLFHVGVCLLLTVVRKPLSLMRGFWGGLLPLFLCATLHVFAALVVCVACLVVLCWYRSAP